MHLLRWGKKWGVKWGKFQQRRVNNEFFHRHVKYKILINHLVEKAGQRKEQGEKKI